MWIPTFYVAVCAVVTMTVAQMNAVQIRNREIGQWRDK
jgi:hypothetical protein